MYARNRRDDDARHELCESDVLTASAQYDVALVYSAALRCRGVVRLGSALVRCASLTVLDVSRNALTTLSGVDAVAATLRVLCAAENALVDVSALTPCRGLERVYLEGNELAAAAAATTTTTTADALSVLASLPCLYEVWLRRSVPLDVDDKDGDTHVAVTSAVAANCLVLDNPLCRDEALYRRRVCALLSHVRWVDGVCMRDGDEDKSSDDADAKTQQQQHPDDVHEYERQLREMNAQALQCCDSDAGGGDEVCRLLQLLQRAQTKCAELLAT